MTHERRPKRYPFASLPDPLATPSRPTNQSDTPEFVDEDLETDDELEDQELIDDEVQVDSFVEEGDEIHMFAVLAATQEIEEEVLREEFSPGQQAPASSKTDTITTPFPIQDDPTHVSLDTAEPPTTVPREVRFTITMENGKLTIAPSLSSTVSNIKYKFPRQNVVQLRRRLRLLLDSYASQLAVGEDPPELSGTSLIAYRCACYLSVLGLSLQDIHNLAERCPTLLYSPVDTVLVPKLVALRDAGLSSADILIVLEQRPESLLLPLEVIKAHLGLVREYKIPPALVLRFVSSYMFPKLRNLDLRQHVTKLGNLFNSKPNEMLKEAIYTPRLLGTAISDRVLALSWYHTVVRGQSPVTLPKLLRQYPWLIDMDVLGPLEEQHLLFKSYWPHMDYYQDFFLTCPSSLFFSQAHIETRIKLLCYIGLPLEKALYTLGRTPRVMGQRLDVLASKLIYLSRELGLTLPDLHPFIARYDSQNVHRYRFLDSARVEALVERFKKRGIEVQLHANRPSAIIDTTGTEWRRDLADHDLKSTGAATRQRLRAGFTDKRRLALLQKMNDAAMAYYRHTRMLPADTDLHAPGARALHGDTEHMYFSPRANVALHAHAFDHREAVKAGLVKKMTSISDFKGLLHTRPGVNNDIQVLGEPRLPLQSGKDSAYGDSAVDWRDVEGDDVIEAVLAITEKERRALGITATDILLQPQGGSAAQTQPLTVMFEKEQDTDDPVMPLYLANYSKRGCQAPKVVNLSYDVHGNMRSGIAFWKWGIGRVFTLNKRGETVIPTIGSIARYMVARWYLSAKHSRDTVDWEAEEKDFAEKHGLTPNYDDVLGYMHRNATDGYKWKVMKTTTTSVGDTIAGTSVPLFLDMVPGRLPKLQAAISRKAYEAAILRRANMQAKETRKKLVMRPLLFYLPLSVDLNDGLEYKIDSTFAESLNETSLCTFDKRRPEDKAALDVLLRKDAELVDRARAMSDQELTKLIAEGDQALLSEVDADAVDLHSDAEDMQGAAVETPKAQPNIAEVQLQQMLSMMRTSLTDMQAKGAHEEELSSLFQMMHIMSDWTKSPHTQQASSVAAFVFATPAPFSKSNACMRRLLIVLHVYVAALMRQDQRLYAQGLLSHAHWHTTQLVAKGSAESLPEFSIKDATPSHSPAAAMKKDLLNASLAVAAAERVAQSHLGQAAHPEPETPLLNSNAYAPVLPPSTLSSQAPGASPQVSSPPPPRDPQELAAQVTLVAHRIDTQSLSLMEKTVTRQFHNQLRRYPLLGKCGECAATHPIFHEIAAHAYPLYLRSYEWRRNNALLNTAMSKPFVGSNLELGVQGIFSQAPPLHPRYSVRRSLLATPDTNVFVRLAVPAASPEGQALWQLPGAREGGKHHVRVSVLGDVQNSNSTNPDTAADQMSTTTDHAAPSTSSSTTAPTSGLLLVGGMVPAKMLSDACVRASTLITPITARVREWSQVHADKPLSPAEQRLVDEARQLSDSILRDASAAAAAVDAGQKSAKVVGDAADVSELASESAVDGDVMSLRRKQFTPVLDEFTMTPRSMHIPMRETKASPLAHMFAGLPMPHADRVHSLVVSMVLSEPSLLSYTYPQLVVQCGLALAEATKRTNVAIATAKTISAARAATASRMMAHALGVYARAQMVNEDKHEQMVDERASDAAHAEEGGRSAREALAELEQVNRGVQWPSGVTIRRMGNHMPADVNEAEFTMVRSTQAAASRPPNAFDFDDYYAPGPDTDASAIDAAEEPLVPVGAKHYSSDPLSSPSTNDFKYAFTPTSAHTTKVVPQGKTNTVGVVVEDSLTVAIKDALGIDADNGADSEVGLDLGARARKLEDLEDEDEHEVSDYAALALATQKKLTTAMMTPPTSSLGTRPIDMTVVDSEVKVPVPVDSLVRPKVSMKELQLQGMILPTMSTPAHTQRTRYSSLLAISPSSATIKLTPAALPLFHALGKDASALSDSSPSQLLLPPPLRPSGNSLASPFYSAPAACMRALIAISLWKHVPQDISLPRFFALHRNTINGIVMREVFKQPLRIQHSAGLSVHLALQDSEVFPQQQKVWLAQQRVPTLDASRSHTVVDVEGTVDARIPAPPPLPSDDNYVGTTGPHQHQEHKAPSSDAATNTVSIDTPPTTTSLTPTPTTTPLLVAENVMAMTQTTAVRPPCAGADSLALPTAPRGFVDPAWVGDRTPGPKSPVVVMEFEVSVMPWVSSLAVEQLTYGTVHIEAAHVDTALRERTLAQLPDISPQSQHSPRFMTEDMKPVVISEELRTNGVEVQVLSSRKHQTRIDLYGHQSIEVDGLFYPSNALPPYAAPELAVIPPISIPSHKPMLAQPTTDAALQYLSELVDIGVDLDPQAPMLVEDVPTVPISRTPFFISHALASPPTALGVTKHYIRVAMYSAPPIFTSVVLENITPEVTQAWQIQSHMLPSQSLLARFQSPEAVSAITIYSGARVLHQPLPLSLTALMVPPTQSVVADARLDARSLARALQEAAAHANSNANVSTAITPTANASLKQHSQDPSVEASVELPSVAAEGAAASSAVALPRVSEVMLDEELDLVVAQVRQQQDMDKLENARVHGMIETGRNLRPDRLPGAGEGDARLSVFGRVFAPVLRAAVDRCTSQPHQLGMVTNVLSSILAAPIAPNVTPLIDARLLPEPIAQQLPINRYHSLLAHAREMMLGVPRAGSYTVDDLTTAHTRDDAISRGAAAALHSLYVRSESKRQAVLAQAVEGAPPSDAEMRAITRNVQANTARLLFLPAADATEAITLPLSYRNTPCAIDVASLPGTLHHPGLPEVNEAPPEASDINATSAVATTSNIGGVPMTQSSSKEDVKHVWEVNKDLDVTKLLDNMAEASVGARVSPRDFPLLPQEVEQIMYMVKLPPAGISSAPYRLLKRSNLLISETDLNPVVSDLARLADVAFLKSSLCAVSPHLTPVNSDAESAFAAKLSTLGKQVAQLRRRHRYNHPVENLVDAEDPEQSEEQNTFEMIDEYSEYEENHPHP